MAEKTHSYFRRGNRGFTHVRGRLGKPATCCGWVCGFLCDYPVGNDKTCDKRLCEDHAHEVAPEIHYCPEHYKQWLEFEKSGGVKNHLENVTPYKQEPNFTRRKI